MGKIACLDHGYVEFVDVMGGDDDIVAAARVSIAGQGVRPVQEDAALIRYLLRNRHTTPFEMVVFKFRVKAPIFVFRQWHRHRMASINEMSGRYSQLPEEFYVPAPAQMAYQSKLNKQGRAEPVAEAAATEVLETMQSDALESFAHYQSYLGKGDEQYGFSAESRAELAQGGGLARELARIMLPLATYSEMIWKTDLHNLFGFLRLRLDKHAQYEIRVYAEAMGEMVRERCPIAWQAFCDFQRDAVTLSRHEQKMLLEIVQRLNGEPDADLAGSIEFVVNEIDWPTKGERNDALAKIRTLLEPYSG